MDSICEIDAWRVLGIPFDATEEEIRKTFHRKLKNGEDHDRLKQAYDLLRDEKARKHYTLNAIHSYFLQPPSCREEAVDLEGVAAEILFLSEWELGEIDASRSS
jgi:hypothetical protein